jgi:hypothetical protein
VTNCIKIINFNYFGASHLAKQLREKGYFCPWPFCHDDRKETLNENSKTWRRATCHTVGRAQVGCSIAICARRIAPLQ